MMDKTKQWAFTIVTVTIMFINRVGIAQSVVTWLEPFKPHWTVLIATTLLYQMLLIVTIHIVLHTLWFICEWIVEDL